VQVNVSAHPGEPVAALQLGSQGVIPVLLGIEVGTDRRGTGSGISGWGGHG